HFIPQTVYHLLFLDPFLGPGFLLRLLLVFFFGTFAPSFLASESTMAMACLRLVTFLPLRPLFNFPRFFSCMALSTFFCSFLEYFAIIKILIKTHPISCHSIRYVSYTVN